MMNETHKANDSNGYDRPPRRTFFLVYCDGTTEVVETDAFLYDIAPHNGTVVAQLFDLYLTERDTLKYLRRIIIGVIHAVEQEPQPPTAVTLKSANQAILH